MKKQTKPKAKRPKPKRYKLNFGLIYGTPKKIVKMTSAEVVKMDKNKIIEEIKNLENHYPKDIFLWDNQEGCDFTRGRFNQFIFQVAENTKEDIIKIILEKNE